MNIPVKTLENGFSMPIYGLGTYLMGGRFEPDYTEDKKSIAAIQAALDAGITHIDTAERYGLGHSEELVGIAMKNYDRSKLFIASKVSGWNQKPTDMRAALAQTLKNLQTDYLDLYILHRFPDTGTSIEEAMKTMNELVDEGLINNIGVSNFSVNRLKITQELSKHKITSNQVHYNVVFREPEHSGLLAYCQKNDILLSAWRPLEKGLIPNSKIITEIATKYQKTHAQVAINWLTSQKNVVTIAKTMSPGHLTENLGALDWTMDAQDIERIRTEFVGQQKESDTLPLNYPADSPA